MELKGDDGIVNHETVNGMFARRGEGLAAWWSRVWGSVRRRLGDEQTPGSGGGTPSSSPDGEIDALALEVFARLQSDGSDAAVEDPQAFLFRLADEVAYERRRRALDHTIPRENWIKTLGLANPEALAITLERFESVMRTLPPCHREALLLHSNAGLSCSEIARRLGLSQHAVMQKLTRTYATLRRELGTH